MNPAELFLRDHGVGHSSSVARHIMNIDPLLQRLSDTQFRARPAGLNSLAWLFWHMTRVEDGCVASAVAGVPQVLDQGWAARLRIQRRDTGTGMTKAEVAELSDQIDLDGLWAYRETVGRRTRTLAAELWPERWTERLTEEDLHRAAAQRVLTGNEVWLVGSTRESLLFWWGLHHTLVHLGQVMMVKQVVQANPT